MTNSTDKEEKKTKKNKKKGPIRFEAIVPVVILSALVGLYFHFFFDSHLRSAASWGATKIYGAEVNIKRIKTSLFNASFELNGLELTDKEKPERNLFSLDKIKFAATWDALLRMKLLVDEASIENIQVYSPRKKPGRVLPPPTESEKKNSLVAQSKKRILDQAKGEFDSNVLGDLASVLGGEKSKDQLGKIKETLEAEKKINSLTSELKEKEKLWEKRLKDLPSEKEFKVLVKKVKDFKIDKRNPLTVAKSVKDLNDNVRELDRKRKAYTSAASDLKSDIKKYEKEISKIDNYVEEDIKSLEKRFKIPDLNMGDFSKKLFAKMFYEKIADYRKYFDFAKEHIPPPKTKEERQAEKAAMVVARKRGEGKLYTFPVTKGYPLFWIKKALVSSKENTSEYSGNVSGEILDLTSDQSIIKKFTKVNIKGNFPKQNVTGVEIKATLDHYTKEAPKQSVITKVGSYPIGGMTFSKSDSVFLAIKKASASLDATAVLKNEKASIIANNNFRNVDWDVSAKSKELNEILKNSLSQLPQLYVNAQANGNWDDLDLDIDSNLGKALANSVKGQVKAKIQEQKEKVRNMVNSKIKAQKDKLNSKFKKVTSRFDTAMAKQKQQLDKAKAEATNAAKSKSKSASGAGTKKLKDVGKKLFKGFGL